MSDQQEAPPQITDQDIESVCRPPALRFAKEMIEFANKKFEGYAPFWCPLVAAFTMRNIVISSMLEGFEPGSDEGLKSINTFMDKLKFDLARHWQSEALKKQFGGRKKLTLAP